MSWLSFESFQARHPDSGLSCAEFAALAGKAELAINEATFWRAATASDPVSLAALGECVAQLIELAMTTSADSAIGASLSGVTSVNNHGYTESYANASQTLAAVEQQQKRIIRSALAGPGTRWMLYAGGVYHPPGRCH